MRMYVCALQKDFTGKRGAQPSDQWEYQSDYSVSPYPQHFTSNVNEAQPQRKSRTYVSHGDSNCTSGPCPVLPSPIKTQERPYVHARTARSCRDARGTGREADRGLAAHARWVHVQKTSLRPTNMEAPQRLTMPSLPISIPSASYAHVPACLPVRASSVPSSSLSSISLSREHLYAPRARAATVGSKSLPHLKACASACACCHRACPETHAQRRTAHKGAQRGFRKRNQGTLASEAQPFPHARWGVRGQRPLPPGSSRRIVLAAHAV